MITPADIENGRILPIDKPYGWSSFQVVNKIKWQIKRELGIKKFKIGHAGTLDPLATGLLLVCVGKATKLIDELQSGTKVYTGTFVLGATTPCYDLERAVDAYYPTSQITPELIEEARLQFVGLIDQVPPMFSAIKVAGARAYSYARDGEEVEIAPKKVRIDQFNITAIRNLPGSPIIGATLADSETSQLIQLADERRTRIAVVIPDVEESQQQASPANESTDGEGNMIFKPAAKKEATELYRHPQGHIPAGLPQIDFRIVCGKGTYIRSIARDLGLALGSGAFLSALRREQVGDYTIANALTITSGEPVAL